MLQKKELENEEVEFSSDEDWKQAIVQTVDQILDQTKALQLLRKAW